MPNKVSQGDYPKKRLLEGLTYPRGKSSHIDKCMVITVNKQAFMVRGVKTSV